MKLLPSKRAWIIAGALIALHLVMWWRIVSYNILYDAGDLSWWLVAFLILPIAAVIILVISSMRRALAGSGDK